MGCRGGGCWLPGTLKAGGAVPSGGRRGVVSLLGHPMDKDMEKTYLCSRMPIKKRYLCLLLAVAALTTLPWLGLTRFNTKGEPREAVVAVAMLTQRNWVLPTNNGGEFAYKPPLFHWMVAATSWITGGFIGQNSPLTPTPSGDSSKATTPLTPSPSDGFIEGNSTLPTGYTAGVNEWTSRFPSALAAIVMVVWSYVFFARRRDARTALVASLVCLSTFEVYRAAYACRVDMLLAMTITGAILSLASWEERHRRWGMLLLAVVMMSLGTLAKGPVAIVLPCLVGGVYMLLRGRNVWATAGWLLLAAVLSVGLPALWYAAAYQQGGHDFLALVMEENVGRFLGKMTYRSHENGLWYYFALLPAGMLPWSLPALVGLWTQRKRLAALRHPHSLRPETLLSVVAFVVIFAFFCIPKSKRSVYLLPLYPFASWGVSLLMSRWEWRRVRVALACVVAVWVVTYAAVVPCVLNRRSDRDIAQAIMAMQPPRPVTSYIRDSDPGDPMHFFTVNFYLGNTLSTWEAPREGYLLIGERDAGDFIAAHRAWQFRLQYTSTHRSCDTHQRLRLYWFYPL